MKASQAQKALEKLILIKQPSFIWGPPGVGKSRIVERLSQEMNLELIDLRAVLLDPVDLRGLPCPKEDGTTKWLTPDFLPTKGKGILFLDELNCAPPLVQAACYQLILDRCLGDYVLPENWCVIAAGNRESDKAVTHRMPSALANRLVHIEIKPELEDWLTWAKGALIRPEIIAFLKYRPNLLFCFDPQSKEKAFASPRSWEFASRILTTQPDWEILSELLQGTVGQGPALELMGFLQIWQDLPQPETVLSRPETARIPLEPATLYAHCEVLASLAKKNTVENLAIYAQRLPAEYGVLLMREAVQNCEEMTRTPAFETWAQKNAEFIV